LVLVWKLKTWSWSWSWKKSWLHHCRWLPISDPSQIFSTPYVFNVLWRCCLSNFIMAVVLQRTMVMSLSDSGKSFTICAFV